MCYGYQIFLTEYTLLYTQPKSVILLKLWRSNIEHISPDLWAAQHTGRKGTLCQDLLLLIRETEDCVGLFLKLYHHIKLVVDWNTDVFTWVSAKLHLEPKM